MSWLIKLWMKANGWKTVIGYVLAQLPWFAGQPMLIDAILKVLQYSDPTTPEGAQAWANLIVQILLLLGVTGIVAKNVKYGTARAGQNLQG